MVHLVLCPYLLIVFLLIYDTLRANRYIIKGNLSVTFPITKQTIYSINNTLTVRMKNITNCISSTFQAFVWEIIYFVLFSGGNQ